MPFFSQTKNISGSYIFAKRTVCKAACFTFFSCSVCLVFTEFPKQNKKFSQKPLTNQKCGV